MTFNTRIKPLISAKLAIALCCNTEQSPLELVHLHIQMIDQIINSVVYVKS